MEFCVKKQLGSNLTSQQKKEVEEISKIVNIDTKSRKELENGLENFKLKLNNFIENKQNELAIAVISPKELFAARNNIRQFVNK
jgi:hypothetical protein